MVFFRAIRDIESERQQRQEQLQQKREESAALNGQLSNTNHHKGQLEQSIGHDKQQEYQLRYAFLPCSHIDVWSAVLLLKMTNSRAVFKVRISQETQY